MNGGARISSTIGWARGRRTGKGTLYVNAYLEVFTHEDKLRAEAPGIYKALPATAEAMYAPELRRNSEDLKLEISN